MEIKIEMENKYQGLYWMGKILAMKINTVRPTRR
jgi:hypothetical protein